MVTLGEGNRDGEGGLQRSEVLSLRAQRDLPRAARPQVWSLDGSRSIAWEPVHMQILRPHPRPTAWKTHRVGLLFVL